MKYITIGEIINVRGIRGVIKVKPLTSDISRFSKLKVVYVDGKPYRLCSWYAEKGFVYIELMEVKNRSDAEKLQGKFLTIDELNAIALDEDEFFIADLIGMQAIFDSGEKLGYIESIDQFGAADVFTITMKNGKKVRFPFLKAILHSVDNEERKFVLKRDKFDEVAVYED